MKGEGEICVFFSRYFSCDEAEVEHVQSRGTSRSVNQPLFLIEFFLVNVGLVVRLIASTEKCGKYVNTKPIANGSDSHQVTKININRLNIYIRRDLMIRKKARVSN